MHPSDEISYESLETVFTYHADPERVPKYVAIMEAAKAYARAIMDNCPNCQDARTAFYQVRFSVMLANAAIALEPCKETK
jgi:hypothetical protein